MAETCGFACSGVKIMRGSIGHTNIRSRNNDKKKMKCLSYYLCNSP